MSAAVERRSRKPITLAHLALLLPWIALGVNACRSIKDNSFLWHVRAGEVQVDTGVVLTSDPFSFTMNGEPWRTQSWLAEVSYSWLEGMSGLGFVGPMMLVTSSIAFVALGLVFYRRSGSVTSTAVTLLLSTLLMLSFIVPRPVLFSYALFALVLLAWDKPSLRWTVPFLFWIWASTHGSFAIGLVYLGLMILAERDWKATITLLAAGLATLATPQGWAIVEVLTGFAGQQDNLSLVAEWRTPDLLEPTLLPLLAGIGILLYGTARQRVGVADLWIIVLMLALAFTAERSVGMAWLGLSPLIAQSMRPALSLRGFPLPTVVVATTVILVVPFLFSEGAQLDDEAFPVMAATTLDDVPTFHDDYVGGYLIWSQWPERLVYIDDRVELYGDRIAEFVAVRAGREDWRPLFARDGIEQALLRSEDPLTRHLTAAGWVSVAEDGDYVVLRPS